MFPRGPRKCWRTWRSSSRTSWRRPLSSPRRSRLLSRPAGRRRSHRPSPKRKPPPRPTAAAAAATSTRPRLRRGGTPRRRAGLLISWPIGRTASLSALSAFSIEEVSYTTTPPSYTKRCAMNDFCQAAMETATAPILSAFYQCIKLKLSATGSFALFFD